MDELKERDEQLSWDVLCSHVAAVRMKFENGMNRCIFGLVPYEGCVYVFV